MEETNLKQVLKECNKSAKTGYKIASAQEKNLNRALASAQEKVQSTIIDFNSSPCYAPEATELLEVQLVEIRDAFNRLSFAFKEDLQNLRENLSKFSVTLFGRTMAGKSTLMEILTEGDGSSIGKGSQRTTRDVRKYTWNGLEITDVPGIGAFEGEDDEQIAFEAAKTADLILFLITDDAPQVAEAECFSRIVNLGKPIICIMNVKASIAEDKSLKLALLGEGLLLLALASIPALTICINMVMADVTFTEATDATWGRFGICVSIVWVLMALMVIAGIWYPASRAMEVQPAEALHDE